MIDCRPFAHQYGSPGINDYSAPPFHVTMHSSQYPAHHTMAGRAVATPGGGGLMGGAVRLNTAGRTGIRRGSTGYGYLGMDPSDPTTWPRPFNPSSGMIGYLNYRQVTP